MQNEMKRLHALGFALIWLKPKSKAPVESKWTSGNRKSLKELMSSARPNYNCGVRLGEPSGLKEGGFLAVIDCDVKSKEPEHLKEMENRLKKLVKVPTPVVLSGRGNGSKHLYIRTKAPVKPRLYARSEKKVRVHMPSVAPSAKEREKLSEGTLKLGWRLRPAWEISIMGTGQQTVLPPSIHPDSGRAYRWAAFGPPKSIPLVRLPKVAPDGAVDKSAETVDSGGFTSLEIDLDLTSLSVSTKKMILDGVGVEDKSAALLSAAIEMVKAGLSRDEILSVLTDPDTFLGEAAYRHAKTKNRKTAARWVERYTVNKAFREHSAEKLFESEVVVSKLENETAVKKQKACIVKEKSWRERLDRESALEGARVKSTLKNLLLILNHQFGPEALFKHDGFANADMYNRDTDWEGSAGEELKDIDASKIREWLSNKWRIEPSRELVEEAVKLICHKNEFHPVREYLDGLEWDGVPRIETWLRDYLGATGPELYLRAVSRKVLIAMVARVRDPGVKFDHVLILEGMQGKGKSTAVEILAKPWFTDATLDPGNKDSVVNMRSIWVVEMGELSGMRHSDIEMWKAFAVRKTDRIRVPFGRRAENFPRQCIFVGTTNSREYLKDLTGNRRFWPVRVKQTRFKALTKDRDQLMAEASFWYDLGETLYLSDEENKAAVIEQGDRVFEDAWVETLRRFFKNPPKDWSEEFSLVDLFNDGGPLERQKDDRHSQMRAADTLRTLGFEHYRKRLKNGNPRRLWSRKNRDERAERADLKIENADIF